MFHSSIIIYFIVFLCILNVSLAFQYQVKSIKVFGETLKYRSNLNPLKAVTEVQSVTVFDNIIKSADKSLVVIDYSTTWCGPCKVAAPKFFDLSEKYPKVIFLKCVGDSVPEAGQLMKREGVRSVPSFHFWKDNQRFEVINGARMDDIEQIIKDKS